MTVLYEECFPAISNPVCPSQKAGFPFFSPRRGAKAKLETCLGESPIANAGLTSEGTCVSLRGLERQTEGSTPFSNNFGLLLTPLAKQNAFVPSESA